MTMFSLMVLIQHLGIVILFIEIFYVLWQKRSELQALVLMVVVSTLVNFVGYLLEIQANTKELALQAVKFIYVGKPFIALATFMFTLKYYKVELSKKLKACLCLIHTAVSVLVLTCDRHQLFYTSIDFVDEGLFPHLVLGHGLIYNLYMILVCVYLVALLVIGVMRYRKADTKRERDMICLLMGIPVVSMIALAILFSGVTQGYDMTVISYLMGTIFLLLLLFRYKLLDTVEVAKENAIDEISQGLIVLDRSYRVIYTNHQVSDVFPEFANGTYEQTLQRMEELAKEKRHLFAKDNVYDVYMKDIVQEGMVYGKMLVLDNITENYQYTIELEKQTAIAKKANKAKSEFLAKMSHEIRTPINAVLGMNEMILREGTDVEIKRYALDIKKAANTLLELINDILDSSKIESGKLQIMPVSYELKALLSDITNMIRIKARDKKLEFYVEVDASVPNYLYGDDVRVRQILINLLNNAIKYTDSGNVTLRVSATKDNDQAIIRFEVEDTGIGIKEEDMPKLYAAFERIEDSRNRNIEGTGLGMSIVVELLHLMGSALSVESRYGIGTTFYFELEQGITKEGTIGTFSSESTEEAQLYKNKALLLAPEAKILVVDDNKINRKVFCNLLKRTQVQIQDVDSGRKCLECVKKERYDMIFMDAMMPEMDGVETLREMKKMNDNLCKGVPVIILTADAVAGAKEHYLSKGFDDFLSKPVTGDLLEKMIIKYLPDNLRMDNL